MVLGANIVGAFLFAAAIIHGHAFDAAVTSAFSADARHLVDGSFGVTMVRAILAGWLIAASEAAVGLVPPLCPLDGP